MKKLVLAMACVLSLGLLASCKNGVQDVNLKNQAKTEIYSAAGTVTFTASTVVTTGTYPSKTWTTTGAAANKSLAGTTVKQFAKVEKDLSRDSIDANYDLYTVTFDTVFDNDTTANNDGDLTYTTGNNAIKIRLYKIGDKWYTDDANFDANTAEKTRAVVEFSEGDPTGNFTIKSLGTISSNNLYWTITDFKFAKAE